MDEAPFPRDDELVYRPFRPSDWFGLVGAVLLGLGTWALVVGLGITIVAGPSAAALAAFLYLIALAPYLGGWVAGVRERLEPGLVATVGGALLATVAFFAGLLATNAKWVWGLPEDLFGFYFYLAFPFGPFAWPVAAGLLFAAGAKAAAGARQAGRARALSWALVGVCVLASVPGVWHRVATVRLIHSCEADFVQAFGDALAVRLPQDARWHWRVTEATAQWYVVRASWRADTRALGAGTCKAKFWVKLPPQGGDLGKAVGDANLRFIPDAGRTMRSASELLSVLADLGATSVPPTVTAEERIEGRATWLAEWPEETNRWADTVWPAERLEATDTWAPPGLETGIQIERLGADGPTLPLDD